MKNNMLTEIEESSITDRLYSKIIDKLSQGTCEQNNDSSLVLLTREEVAKYLKTTVQTVALLQEMKVINAIHIGKNYLTSKDELLRFYSDYRGLDVSNRYRIEESKKVVEARKGSSL